MTKLSRILCLLLAIPTISSAASQTIAFPAIPNQILGTSPFVIAATASSGLPVAFASTTPTVCKASGSLIMLLSVGSCSITASQAGNGSFSPATSLTNAFTVSQAKPAGMLFSPLGNPFNLVTNPWGFAVADFNGDGYQDVAVGSFAGAYVYLGNSSGEFTAATGSPFGSDMIQIVTGDFNGDGIPDLAGMSAYGLTVLLGNGTGGKGTGGFTLVSGSPFYAGPTGGGPTATGDFNGDGIQDLAFVEPNGTNIGISIMLGDGTGRFSLSATAATPLTFPQGAYALTVSDFNNDGIQDLALIAGDNHSVYVLLGNGSGGFSVTASSPISVGTLLTALAVGDFNRDGIPDIALADVGVNEEMYILLGNGAGAFTLSTLNVGAQVVGLALGDFNGDGIQDIALSTSEQTRLSVLPGKGDGSFSAPVSSSSSFTGSYGNSILAADMNGDGIEDVVLFNGSGALNVVLGEPAYSGSSLTLTSAPTIDYGQSVSLSLVVSDIVPAYAAPTGTATFKDGTAILGTANQSASPYTLSATDLSAGSHTLTAAYNGDSRTAASTSNSITVQVNQATQTISFGALSDAPINSGPITLTATATSGLAVSLVSTTASICTVSGNAVTLVTTGACSITASQAGNANYLAATSIVRAFNIAPRSQTITFGPLSNVPLTTGTFTLNAAASSSLAVSYTSNSTSVCTVAASTVTLVAYGICSITATQAGNPTWAAATPVTQTFSVFPPTPAITSVTPNSLPALSAATPITIAGSNFVNGATVTFTPPNSTPQTIAPSLVQAAQIAATIPAAFLTTGGTAQISVNNGFSAFSTNVPFTISTVGQTIVFDPIPSQILGNSPVQIVAHANSGLPVTISSTPMSVCKTSGTRVTLLAAGTCSITASQSGNGGYNPAPSVTQSFNVSLANPSGSFTTTATTFNPPLPFISIATADFNGDGIPDAAVLDTANTVRVLLGTGSGTFTTPGSTLSPGGPAYSVVAGDFNTDGKPDLAISLSNSVVILLGDGAGHFSGAPGGPVAVGQFGRVLLGDFNNDGAEDLAVSTADSMTRILLGDGAGGLALAPGSPFATGEVLAVGDFNGDGITDLLTTANYLLGTVTTMLGNGSGGFATGRSYAIGQEIIGVGVGDFNGDGFADIAVGTNDNGVPILIADGLGGFHTNTTLAVTGTSIGPVVVGDFNGDGIQDLAALSRDNDYVTILLGNGSGGFAATTGGPIPAGIESYSLVAGDFNGDGIEDLLVGGGGNLTALPGFATGNTSQTITFGPLGNIPLGTVTLTVAASSGSSLPVSFASASPSVCTVAGNTVTLLSVDLPGDVCVIIARQPGNSTYAPAPAVEQSFSTLGSQNIAFGSLANRALSAGAFTLAATTTSGLAVSYSSNGMSICTVSGTLVTLVTYGTCSITASQAGDGTYGAASPVTQTFTVLQSTPSITSVTPNAVLVSSAATAVTIAGSNFLDGATVSFTPPGGTAQTITPSLVQAAQIAATIPAAYLTSAGTAQVAVSNGFGAVSGNLPFTISATALPQTITFSSQLGLSGALTATASSGLAVTFTSNTSGCTVTGSTVNFGSNNTCSITASQPGNGNYAAATAVTQSFVSGSGSGAVTCGSPVANPVFIRAEGQTEQVADVTISCYGGAATVNLQVYLSPAVSITSGTVATANGTESETTAGLGATGSTFASGAVHGTVSGSSVGFNGIQTGAGSFNLTITNIKVNASQAASLSGAPAGISETIFVSGTNVTPGVLPATTVAFVTNGLTGIQSSGPLSYPVCSAISATMPAFNVQFSEGFPTAFRSQGSAAANSTIGSWLTNGTETGYGVIASGNNTATFGTRVKVVFDNVPAGASVYVPLTLANSGGTMTLTASETGIFSAVAASSAPGAPANSGALTVTGASAVAVYEVTTSAPISTETYTVPVYLVANSGTISSSAPAITATVSFAPINASADTPDFVSGSSTVTVTGAAFAPCGSGTPQTISFVAPGNTPLTVGGVGLSATASSGLPVTFTSTTPGTCAGIGDTATLIAAGTCSITATQPGSTTYAAAPPVTRSFTITPSNAQSITFGSLPNVATGTAPFSIAATATSGLAVSFASNTSSVCTVSGSIVTLSGAGTCSITASQTGNGSYLAATPVTQTFSVLVNTGPATCTSNASAVFVRSEGTNEKLGDATISCTGGNALPMNFTVYLSPAVSIASATVSGVSEIVAGLGTTGQSLAPGAVNGIVSGSAVTFTNVPTTSGDFTLTITNIRINGSQLATNNNVPIAIPETMFLSGDAVTPTVLPAVNAAYATPGLTGVRATGANSIPVCSAMTAALPNFSVQFVEGFPNAFQMQGSAAGNSTLGSWWSGTETGYGVALGGASNTATSGTRVKVVFSNVPANAAIYAPLTIANSGGVMTLTASEAGIFSAVAASTSNGAPANSGALAVSGGSATAIYEETTAAPTSVETYTVPVYLVAAAGAVSLPSPAIAATVSFAPIGAPGNVPNFVSGASTTVVAGSSFIACGTGSGTQTISFAPIGNTISGMVTLSAAASSGLPISFTDNTPGVCSLSGNTVTVIGAGQCSITATQGGDADYAAATPVTQTFIAGSANVQTINFPTPPAQAAGLGFIPTVSVSSGLPVTLTSTTLSVCTVFDGNDVSLNAPGTCTITANQPGNSSYAAAVSVTRSFQVVTATGTATCAVSSNPIFVRAEGTTEQVADTGLSCTGGNGLPMNITIYLSPAVTVTSAAVGSAGSEALAGLGTTGGVFTGAPVSGTVSGSSLTFTNVPTSVGAFTITVTNIKINASQIAITNGAPAAISEAIFLSGSAVTPTVLQLNNVAFATSGLSGITATGAAAFPVCSAIPSASPAFSVHFAEGFATSFKTGGTAAANTTLGSEFANGTETGYGVTSNGASNTATSGTRVKIVFNNVPANLTLAVPLTISNSGGTMTLTAAETGPFSSVPASGPNGAVLSVVNGTAAAVYEETTTAPAAIESYTVPVYLTGSAGTVPSQSLAITATVSFAPILAGGNVPDFVSGSSTVTVNGATFTPCGSTITFPSLTNVPFGTGNVNLTATSTSPAPITFSSTTPSVCTVSNNIVSLVAGGSCSITASQTANPYYAAAASVVESFTVTPGPQTISFGSIGNVPFSSATVAVSAAASSSLPVSFASSTPAVCTVANASVTLVAPGSCTIVASQAGNPSYAAAPTAQQSFTISEASQTITFDQIPNQLLGISPFAIAAQSNSGLTVGVASTTASVCKVSGRIVTLLSAGTCSLKATQAGNADFGAATVTQSFTVSHAKPSGGLNATAASPLLTNANPSYVATGDFNGDGFTDLAVADAANATVTILLGNGQGSFRIAAGSPFALASTHPAPAAVAVGDFNGDGSLDLAVSSSDSTIRIFLGNGSGAFSPASAVSNTGAPRDSLADGGDSLAAADFNGDGLQDLVTSDGVVFLGNGAGGFTAGTGPFVSSRSSLPGLSARSSGIVRHPDAGVIVTGGIIFFNSAPLPVVVGDFNNDGNQDFVLVGSSYGELIVMLGDGAGDFTASSTSPIAIAAGVNGLAAADFNGDGNLDLVISSTLDYAGSTTILLGDGKGGFSQPAGSPWQSGSLNSQAVLVTVGDFNGDGHPDVAIAGTDIEFLLGVGDGTFSGARAPEMFPGGDTSLVVGDFNGDGLIDLVTTQIGSNGVDIFPGGLAGTRGALTTTSPLSIPFGQSVPLSLALSNTSAAFTNPTGTASFSDGANALGAATQTTSPYTFNISSLSVGTHNLTASYSGDANNAASTSNTLTVTVTQAPQTITFDAPAAVTLPVSPFALAAASTSILPVAFTSNTTNTCTVSGTTVTPLTAGTCTIVASQPGNANYLAATPVTQSFTINPAVSSGGAGGGGGGGGATGGGTPLTIAPSSVTISAATGGGPGTSTITLSYQTFTQGAPSFSAAFNLNQGQGWLSVSPSSGTMSLGSTSGLLFNYTATVTISGDPTNLTAGNTYTGTVNVTSAGSIVSVPVTLNVTSQPAKYNIAPQSLSFSYQQGSTTQPANQSLSVFSTPTGGTFTATASSTGNWLSIGTGTTTPASLAVSVNTAGLQPNTYSGTITITAGSSVSINVPVTLTITKATPPILAVSPASQNLNATQGASASTGQITVSNTGGGTLQFTASSDQPWLTTASSGAATPTAPASLAFSADPSQLTPGVYTGHITVSGASASQSATIVLTVTNTAARIQIAQTGISMTAIAGGSAPQPQTVSISNSGSGTLNWSAQTSTTSGGNWLTAAQTTGAVTISANTAGLAAGQYYGAINILSANATNSPQTIAVALNVVAATAAPGISVSTGGVLFEGNTALTQSVNLYNPSASAITYSASVFGSWLSVSPASGTANPGTNSITIAADLSQITGVQQGSVTIAFGDGSSASIEVVALVVGGSGHVVAGIRPMVTTSICAGGKASYLIPIFRGPSAGSSAQVAAATTIQLQLVDDCGNNVTSANGGSAQITFSNGDPGLTLNDIGNGIWEATWVPQNAAKSVTLQAAASQNGLSIGSAVSALSSETVTVLAAGANAPPAPTGIANAASAAQATPQLVAPGSYIAIYGTNLSGTDNPSAATLPLPTTLNGTQLFLGGLPMPLLYAGAGQVNALVPEGIAPNATYPLTVVRGTTQSVPVPITVTELQPGAYTVDTSGSGAGIVTNALTGALIAPSNPAHAGDYLVIYATGLGQLTGQNGETEPTDGAAAPSTTIYRTNASVSVNIGGTTIPASFAGLTPSFAGLYQVNIQVPQGVTTGNSVPIRIVATDAATGATSTGNAITIAIQ